MLVLSRREQEYVLLNFVERRRSFRDSVQGPPRCRGAPDGGAASNKQRIAVL